MIATSKVVAIDDDQVTLKLLATVLGDLGFQVVEASSAGEGFRRVRTENPHLIILDVNMPDRDGLSLLAEFHRDPDLKKIPVLMLTSELKFKGAGLAFELGAAAYMTKPFTPQALKTKVEELLFTPIR